MPIKINFFNQSQAQPRANIQNPRPSFLNRASNFANKASTSIKQNPILGFTSRVGNYVGRDLIYSAKNPQEIPRILNERYVQPPVKFSQKLGEAAALPKTNRAFEQIQKQNFVQSDLYLKKAIELNKQGDKEGASNFFKASQEALNRSKTGADERISEMGKAKEETITSGVGTMNTAAALAFPGSTAKTMAIGGLFSSALEGATGSQKPGGFYRGVDSSSKYAGFVNISNPIIAGVVGKYASQIDSPVVKSLLSRTGNAIGNLLEDRGLSAIYNEDTSLTQDLTSLAIGFILGGKGDIKDWDNLKKQLDVHQFDGPTKDAFEKIIRESTKLLNEAKTDNSGFIRIPGKGDEVPPKADQTKVKPLGPQVEPKMEIPETRTREKSFLTRASKTEAAGDEFVQEVKKNPMRYIQHTNEEAANWAINKIETEGVDDALSWARNIKVLELENEGDKVTAVGMMSIQKLVNDGEPQKAAEVASEFDRILRGGGRVSQAARMWGEIADSPDTMVQHAKDTYDEANKRLTKFREVKLTEKLEKEIREKSQKIFSIQDSKAREKAAFELKSLIAKQVPPSAVEWIDAYRYQNMLSGYANLRNLIGNLTTTFITRPYEMLLETPVDFIRANIFGAERRAYDRNTLDYFKGARNAIPEANELTKAVWTRQMPITRPDYSPQTTTPQQLAAQQRTPGVLSVFPRLMEASDVWLRTIIAGGEYEARVKAGEGKEEAAKKAFELSNRMLGRGFGTDTKETRQLLKQLDTTKNWMVKFRDSNIFTKTLIPFISTSFEFAGERLQRNIITGPITTIGAEDQTEQWAKVVGSILPLALGAYKASQNNTTWVPPQDEDARNAWYASGRKRYSMRIELPKSWQEKTGKEAIWIPFFYLGLHALSAAIPAAWNHYANQQKDADLKKDYEKVAETTMALLRYTSGELPVQSALEYIDILTGEAEDSVWEGLVFQSEQFIPLSAMQRDLAKMIDPVFRQTEKPFDEWKRSVPWFFSILEGKVPSVEPKRELLPYLEPQGTESTRGILDYLPYAVGTQKSGTEAQLERSKGEGTTPQKLYQRELKKLNDIQQQISRNRDMSSDEKRRRLTELNQRRKDLREEYQQMIVNQRQTPKGPTITPKQEKQETKRAPVFINGVAY